MASRDPLQRQAHALRVEQAHAKELAESKAYRWLLTKMVERREKARDRALQMTQSAGTRDWLAGVAFGIDEAMKILEKEAKKVNDELSKLVGSGADV